MSFLKEMAVRLSADARPLKSELAAASTSVRKFEREASGSVTGYSRKITEAQGTSKRFSSALRGDFGGLAATVAGGFVGVSVGNFLRDSVSAASDLNESVSKTKVVFGDSADAVLNFSKTAARSIGLSRQQAAEAAASFGNLFTAMRIGQPPAAAMSVSLVKLAGDLASFNNTRPEDALEALRSGLVGETEPLRRYGVNINQAGLQQEALRLGLIRTVKDGLTPAAKAQASYSLILQQTRSAQGDAGRTGDQLAGQQRRLTAEWKDAEAVLGQKLLPVIVDLAHFATGTLIPAVSGVVQVGGEVADLFGHLPGPAQDTAKALLAVGLGGVAISKAFGLIRATAAPAIDLLLGKKAAQVAANAEIAASYDAVAVSAGAAARAELAAAGGGGVAAVGGAVAGGGAAAAVRTGGLLGAGGLASKTGGAARALGPIAAVVGTAELVTKVPDIKLPGPSWLTGTISLNKILGGGGSGSAKSVTKALKDQAPAAVAAAQSGSALGRVQAQIASLNASATKNYSLYLRGLKDTTAAVLSAIPAFGGYKAASDVTARSILKNLHQEVGAYTDWAKNTQTLLRRGVDPAVVKALSDKGPEYVAAFVHGSDRQLADLKGVFGARVKAAGAEAALQSQIGGGATGAAYANALRAKNTAIQLAASTAIGSGVGKAIQGATADSYAGGVAAGSALGRGLSAGMRSRLAEVQVDAAALAHAAIRGVRTTAGIRSPSSVFAELGRSTAEGYALGLERHAALAAAASARMAAGAAKAAGGEPLGLLSMPKHVPLGSVLSTSGYGGGLPTAGRPYADVRGAAVARQPKVVINCPHGDRGPLIGEQHVHVQGTNATPREIMDEAMSQVGIAARNGMGRRGG